MKDVAPVCNDNTFDIVDESLHLLKTNFLFSIYEIEGESVAKISNQEVFTQALKQFAFPLNTFFHEPKDLAEIEIVDLVTLAHMHFWQNI